MTGILTFPAVSVGVLDCAFHYRQSFQRLLKEDAWYGLGKLHFKMGRPEEGRKAFEHLLKNFPNSKYKDEVQTMLAPSEQKDKQ